MPERLLAFQKFRAGAFLPPFIAEGEGIEPSYPSLDSLWFSSRHLTTRIIPGKDFELSLECKFLLAFQLKTKVKIIMDFHKQYFRGYGGFYPPQDCVWRINS